MPEKSILVISCDPYLAGLYGRKFENDGWEVMIAENFKEADILIAKNQPNIALIQKECSTDIVSEVIRIKSMPSAQKMKIVILAKDADLKEVQASRNAGASDYLLIGHFVAHEAVEKMRELLNK
ncbi:hypothetical protein KJ673_00080 [Patescibacteria group bacterium]|nr:hypothetical protein [Patescibacteria group bacterium]MBU4452650.1 hypothetical protein [Patescibacteria group bacterium]MCG2687485.1 hypothetical protein [Candidatus Parcubacteria bacterium]